MKNAGNPFTHLLRAADDLLVRQSYESRTPLVNRFFHSSILKQRIQMLQKPASSYWALLRYAAVLPLGLTLLMCTQELPMKESVPAKPTAGARITVGGDEVFTVVEKAPEFPGGTAGLFNYLSQNIKYPAEAAKAGVGGRVFVTFIVNTDGTISNAEVLKGVREDLNAEALRVVSQMPAWKPGTQSGKLVRVKYNLPIAFQTEEQKAEQAGTAPKPSFYVVDGVEQPADFQPNSLNPDQIVSIDVLKGASATAQYGDRAKDGVIVVVTKSNPAVSNPKPSSFDISKASLFFNDKPITKAEMEKMDPALIKEVRVTKDGKGNDVVRMYGK
ncbi:TonB family protein [Tellurirhabdus rosea]|uniref:TonB family protein n=1 Tax=Tellurirhabdus rosea TaxID=2674997 RepID=UPI0022513D20|nr:TonB family protein [Tellurirhabdus rosea]